MQTHLKQLGPACPQIRAWLPWGRSSRQARTMGMTSGQAPAPTRMMMRPLWKRRRSEVSCTCASHTDVISSRRHRIQCRQLAQWMLHSCLLELHARLPSLLGMMPAILRRWSTLGLQVHRIGCIQALARAAGEESGDEGELAALNDEADMPLEQLMALYGYVPEGGDSAGEASPSEGPVGRQCLYHTMISLQSACICCQAIG